MGIVVVVQEFGLTERSSTLIRFFRDSISPARHQVLLDIKQRILFNKPATVEQHLLELADEWRWSEDPVTFEKQFIERYPEEFAALREKLSDIRIARRMKRADLPPLEVVQKLKNLVKDAPDT
jgi:hypothetical protein